MVINGYDGLTLVSGLKKLIADDRKMNSLKLKYSLMKVSDLIKEEIDPFYKVRDEIILKHGEELQDSPGMYRVKQDNIGAFNIEIDSILKDDLRNDYNITQNTFDSILEEDVNLTEAEIRVFEKLIFTTTE